MRNCTKCLEKLDARAKEPMCLRCRKNLFCECGNKRDWRADHCRKCDGKRASEAAKKQWQIMRDKMLPGIQAHAAKRKGVPIKPIDYCSMDGCNDRVDARMLCHKHYVRWRNFGTPELTTPTAEERFWARIKKTKTCWLWTGHLNNNGYGMLSVKGRHTLAHRFSFKLANGYAPTKHILHSCDTPACVNPAHLREGTQQENMRDSVIRGRHVRGSRSPVATLNEEQVAEIKRLLKSKTLLQREIAERFNTTQNIVCSINLNKSWKHVTI